MILRKRDGHVKYKCACARAHAYVINVQWVWRYSAVIWGILSHLTRSYPGGSSGATGTKSSKKAPSLTRWEPSQPMSAPGEENMNRNISVHLNGPVLPTQWAAAPKLLAAAVANSAGSTPWMTICSKVRT